MHARNPYLNPNHMGGGGHFMPCDAKIKIKKMCLCSYRNKVALVKKNIPD